MRLTVAVVSTAVDEMATQLYVDPSDVHVILATLTDEPIADAVSNEFSGEVRMILDGFGFRTMPQLWNQVDSAEAGRRTARPRRARRQATG